MKKQRTYQIEIAPSKGASRQAKPGKTGGAKSAKPKGVKLRTVDAGGYDAVRGGRLQHGAALARASALIEALKAKGPEAMVALDRAFAGELRKPRDAEGRRGSGRWIVDGDRDKAGKVLNKRLIDVDDATLDVERLVREAGASDDIMARLERVARELGVELTGKAARAVRTAERRAAAHAAAAVDAAQKHGAHLPTVELGTKRSWRVQVIDTPEGSIAKPAYVVHIEPNAPIGRLSRAARPGDKPALEQRHVRAASEVCALYFASMKNAKLVGSYDGVIVDNAGGERAHPLDTASASWAKLEAALKGLLPVEQRVVMEVCVYETPIEALARRRDLVHFVEPRKAAAAVTQTLRCGLERLADTWGIDLGSPQKAST